MGAQMVRQISKGRPYDNAGALPTIGSWKSQTTTESLQWRGTRQRPPGPDRSPFWRSAVVHPPGAAQGCQHLDQQHPRSGSERARAVAADEAGLKRRSAQPGNRSENHCRRAQTTGTPPPAGVVGTLKPTAKTHREASGKVPMPGTVAHDWLVGATIACSGKKPIGNHSWCLITSTILSFFEQQLDSRTPITPGGGSTDLPTTVYSPGWTDPTTRGREPA